MRTKWILLTFLALLRNPYNISSYRLHVAASFVYGSLPTDVPRSATANIDGENTGLGDAQIGTDAALILLGYSGCRPSNPLSVDTSQLSGTGMTIKLVPRTISDSGTFTNDGSHDTIIPSLPVKDNSFSTVDPSLASPDAVSFSVVTDTALSSSILGSEVHADHGGEKHTPIIVSNTATLTFLATSSVRPAASTPTITVGADTSVSKTFSTTIQTLTTVNNQPMVLTTIIPIATTTAGSSASVSFPQPVSRRKLATVLGGALGSTGFVILSASCFIVVRRKRKRQNAPTNHSTMLPGTETAYGDLERGDSGDSERAGPILRLKAVIKVKESIRKLRRKYKKRGLAAPTGVDQGPSYIGSMIAAGTGKQGFAPKHTDTRIDQGPETQGSSTSAAARESFQPEEVARLRQLLATIQSSQQASSTTDSQAEMRELREEVQRLRHLVVLQPPPEPQGRESDTRSWTTSLPAYDG